MQESEAELGELQALLDGSLARATGHLRSIVRPGRSLTAAHLVRVISRMCTLAVSSVTAAGEPRVSGADGHLVAYRVRPHWMIAFAADPEALLARLGAVS
jgi:hypothetical protein